MKSFRPLPLSLGILLVGASVRADESPRLEIVSQRTILAKDDVQLHFPFLHEAKNGTWYMTYREGRHGSNRERVYCVTSADRGKSWQPWTGLQAEPELRLFRRRLSDGTFISHRYQFTINDQAAGSGFILRSSDDGATWSKIAAPLAGLPFVPGKPAGLWGHIVEMPDGRLLCGLYGKTPEDGKYINGLVESNDDGKSWRYLSHLCDDPSLGNEGPDEMDLVRLESGELLGVFRTGTQPDSHMHQVRSTDGGKTWSRPRDLGSVGVSPQLLLLTSGVLVCTYGTRDVYAMAGWDGSGREWSKPRLIYEGEGSGYTDLQALSEATFRIVFDRSPFFSSKPGGKIMRVVVAAEK